MSIVGYTKDKLDSLFGGKADLTGGTVPDAQLPSRLSDVELRAAFVSVLIYASGAYPARPAGVPGGLVKYIGPVQPSDWLSNDEWVNNS